MKVELLAPSGNFECVRAAVSNGADAVYLGGQQFNARAFANNFSNEELAEVCDYCHSYGVKVYVTVNTLYHTGEFEQLVPFIDELYAMGVDGLIMQDLGAIAMVRKYWPDLPVHVSTQLTSNSTDDIRFYEDMGISTVVVSREMSLEELREMVQCTDIRIEPFIHGALCVSYSGQCLMSSVIGNRSGNRGRCAQNCRLNYDLLKNNKKAASGHLLSTKDICTLDLLPELLDTGVASLKIEGRMKSPEYVAGVTAVYRKYIDLYYSKQKYAVDPADRKILLQLFNRGQFSSGYLKTHSGSSMMCPIHPKNWGVLIGRVTAINNNMVTIRTEDDLYPGDGIEIWTDNEEGTGCYINKEHHAGESFTIRLEWNIKKGQAVYQTYNKHLNDLLQNQIKQNRRKVSITGAVRLQKYQFAELKLNYGKIAVSVTGDIVDEAVNQPLSEDIVSTQISRLGNTVFQLDKLRVIMDDDIYLNRSQLNRLKNEAADKLLHEIIESYHRVRQEPVLEPAETETKPEGQTVSVMVDNDEQLQEVLRHENVETVYCPIEKGMDVSAVIEAVHASGKKIFFALPRVWRTYIKNDLADELRQIEESDADGYLISNVGHYHYVQDKKRDIHLDIYGNVINDYCVEFWKDKVSRIGISVESDYGEMKTISDKAAMEVMVYGKIPLMMTHQCPVGNFVGGKTDHKNCRERGNHDEYVLRNGSNLFRVKTDCASCLAIIYSNIPVNVTGNLEAICSGSIRYNFTDESVQEIREILNGTRTEGQDIYNRIVQ